jgi:hypothetical protein
LVKCLTYERYTATPEEPQNEERLLWGVRACGIFTALYRVVLLTLDPDRSEVLQDIDRDVDLELGLDEIVLWPHLWILVQPVFDR